MNYLLDTCVISELVAKKPDSQVLAWIDSLANERVFLSVLTVGEIRRGVFKLPDSNRRTTLVNWLETDLLARFSGRILALDVAVLLKWGALTARLEGIGRPMPAIDSLFAAQALTYQMNFATRNTKDFIDTGVNLVNPWQTEESN